MGTRMSKLKHAVAAIFAVTLSAPLSAQDRPLDDLFDALRQAEGDTARAIAAKIWQEWSRSGSPAMDLLLERGRKALEEGDGEAAIGHFSALIDHAPDFAEGYNMRATAFYQQGHAGLALADLRQALALNPRHFGALTGLASILEQLDEKEAALRAWREVRELNPSAPAVDEAIGRLERITGGTAL